VTHKQTKDKRMRRARNEAWLARKAERDLEEAFIKSMPALRATLAAMADSFKKAALAFKKLAEAAIGLRAVTEEMVNKP